MQTSTQRPRIYYGWWVALAAALVVGVTTGTGSSCLSVFLKPMSESLGVTRAQIGVMTGILNLGSVLLSLVWGRVCDRLPVWRLMAAASVIVPGCYLALGTVRGLGMLYAIAAVEGVFKSLLGPLVFTVLLSGWFYDRRGFALGVMMAGSGAGGTLFTWLSGVLLGVLGWRQTLFLFAGVQAVVVIPLMLFVIRVRPEERGCQPLGAPPAPPQRAGAQKQPAPRLLTGRYLLILLLFIMMTLSIGVLLNILTPYLSDCGFSSSLSASALSVMTAVSALLSLAAGAAIDRFGIRWIGTLLLLGAAGGFVLALFTGSVAAVFLAAALVGLGSAFGQVAPPFLIAKFCDPRSAVTALGLIHGLAGICNTLIPVVANLVFDRTGSYQPVLFCVIGFGALDLVFFWLLYLKIPKRKEHTHGKCFLRHLLPGQRDLHERRAE